MAAKNYLIINLANFLMINESHLLQSMLGISIEKEKF